MAWLERLYPLCAELRPSDFAAATQLAVNELLLSGCTTATDHEECLTAEIDAARELGIRLHLIRGCLPTV